MPARPASAVSRPFPIETAFVSGRTTASVFAAVLEMWVVAGRVGLPDPDLVESVASAVAKAAPGVPLRTSMDGTVVPIPRDRWSRIPGFSRRISRPDSKGSTEWAEATEVGPHVATDPAHLRSALALSSASSAKALLGPSAMLRLDAWARFLGADALVRRDACILADCMDLVRQGAIDDTTRNRPCLILAEMTERLDRATCDDPIVLALCRDMIVRPSRMERAGRSEVEAWHAMLRSTPAAGGWWVEFLSHEERARAVSIVHRLPPVDAIVGDGWTTELRSTGLGYVLMIDDESSVIVYIPETR